MTRLNISMNNENVNKNSFIQLNYRTKEDEIFYYNFIENILNCVEPSSSALDTSFASTLSIDNLNEIIENIQAQLQKYK